MPTFLPGVPPRDQPPVPDGASTSPDLVWAAVKRAVARHPWAALSGLAAWLLLAGLYAFVLPPTWEGVARLRIENSGAGIPDPVQRVSIGDRVATEMQVLESQRLAGEAVDSLSLRLRVGKPWFGARSALVEQLDVRAAPDTGTVVLTRLPDGRFSVAGIDTTRLDTVAVGQPVRHGGVGFTLAKAAAEESAIELELIPRADAMLRFTKALDVRRPARDADVVEIAFRSGDQPLAVGVPNFLVRRFLSGGDVSHSAQARASVGFLRQQLDTLSRQLAASEATLKGYREQQQVVNLDVESGEQVRRMATVQAERASVEAERRALGEVLDRAGTGAEPGSYRRLIAFPTLLRNQTASELLRGITDLEQQKTQLLSRRTLQDSDVQLLQGRIDELDLQLRGIALTYQQGLTAQVSALDSSLRTFSAALDRMPAKQVEVARLEREPKVLAEMYAMLTTRLKEAEIAAASLDPSIQVVDDATTPWKPVSPRRGIGLAAGLLFGVLSGAFLALRRESADRSVHTRGDLQLVTGAGVLAMIPSIADGGWGGRIRKARALPIGGDRVRRRVAPEMAVGDGVVLGQRNGNGALSHDEAPGGRLTVPALEPTDPAAEAYNRLFANLGFVRPEGMPQTVLITSPLAGEGKTTTALNLAVTSARRGLRTLLVDADLRRGVINRLVGMRRTPGVSDVLQGTATLEQALRGVAVGAPQLLQVLTTGRFVADPGALVSSAAMRALLADLRTRFDMIVLDSAPLNLVSDATVLAQATDGVVLVARAGATVGDALVFAAEQLRAAHAPLLGTMLNDIDVRRDGAYDGAYEYYGLEDAYRADEKA